MILTALFTALVFLATRFIIVTLPSGAAYINAGDAVILMSSFILGGPLGAAAAGIGSIFADLSIGAAIYAPATLIIKSCMGLVAGSLLRKSFGFFRMLLVFIVTELIMVAGYFAYDLILFRKVAFVNAGFNLAQAVFAVILAAGLIYPLKKNPYIINIRKK